jgi:hypothetical protein
LDENVRRTCDRGKSETKEWGKDGNSGVEEVREVERIRKSARKGSSESVS